MLFSSLTILRVQNYTGVGTPVEADDTVFMAYKISYMYFCMVGTLLGVAVGLITTLLTGSNNVSKLNPDLVAPPIRRFLNSYKEKPNKPEEHKLVPKVEDTKRRSSINPGT